MTEDDRPAGPPATHAVGEPLGTLSVHELDERIVLLRGEIARLERERAAKRAAADAADSVFGRQGSGGAGPDKAV